MLNALTGPTDWIHYMRYIKNTHFFFHVRVSMALAMSSILLGIGQAYVIMAYHMADSASEHFKVK